MSLSTGEESVWLHLKPFIRDRWWFKKKCDRLWSERRRGTVLCQRRHSLISVTHIILISSLGSFPGAQPILNNSSFCRSLSSNHLEAGIRNTCTEPWVTIHRLVYRITPYRRLIEDPNLKLFRDFVTKVESEGSFLYLHNKIEKLEFLRWQMFSRKKILKLEKSIWPMDFHEI